MNIFDIEIFNYLDIGSANFDGSAFSFLEDGLCIEFFEPDARSADFLEEAGFKVHRTALSDQAGEVRLNLTKKPEVSSVLAPKAKAINRYPNPERFSVVDTVSVNCDTLDGVCNGNVDFMKLDVQGSELPILVGGVNALSRCIGLEVEVYFTEFYESQPLFCDIDKFLRGHGFTLLDIKNQKHFARDGYYGAGELIFADAVYVKAKKDMNFDWCDERFRKWLAVHFAYENYGEILHFESSLPPKFISMVKSAKSKLMRKCIAEYWLNRLNIIRPR